MLVSANCELTNLRIDADCAVEVKFDALPRLDPVLLEALPRRSVDAVVMLRDLSVAIDDQKFDFAFVFCFFVRAKPLKCSPDSSTRDDDSPSVQVKKR